MVYDKDVNDFLSLLFLASRPVVRDLLQNFKRAKKKKSTTDGCFKNQLCATQNRFWGALVLLRAPVP